MSNPAALALMKEIQPYIIISLGVLSFIALFGLWLWLRSEGRSRI